MAANLRMNLAAPVLICCTVRRRCHICTGMRLSFNLFKIDQRRLRGCLCCPGVICANPGSIRPQRHSCRHLPCGPIRFAVQTEKGLLWESRTCYWCNSNRMVAIAIAGMSLAATALASHLLNGSYQRYQASAAETSQNLALSLQPSALGIFRLPIWHCRVPPTNSACCSSNN